jgi:hypothetical protein
VSKQCGNCRFWSRWRPDAETRRPKGWGDCEKLPELAKIVSSVIMIVPPPSMVATSEHFCCSLHERQMQVVTRHDG